jgi:hypothetical protein
MTVIQIVSAQASTRSAPIRIAIPDGQLQAAIDPIRQNAEWIGGSRIDQVHRHQDDRHERHRSAHHVP